MELMSAGTEHVRVASALTLILAAVAALFALAGTASAPGVDAAVEPADEPTDETPTQP